VDNVLFPKIGGANQHVKRNGVKPSHPTVNSIAQHVISRSQEHEANQAQVVMMLVPVSQAQGMMQSQA
jgi:hypothetical protein